MPSLSTEGGTDTAVGQASAASRTRCDVNTHALETRTTCLWALNIFVVITTLPVWKGSEKILWSL